MDQLMLLAQFRKLQHSKCKQKYLLFSKKLDVNYSIPEDPPNLYSGQTALHFAVCKMDVDTIKDLIVRGADLFKQGLECRCTPLHIATKFIHNEEEQQIWRFTGKLDNEPVINLLLSEQIKSGNRSNPKNKEGISHLHIASIFNHVEGVKFLKDSVNDTVYVSKNDYYLPGFTALHFAIRYSSVEAAEILLKNGADIHLKDVNSMSPVHLLIHRFKKAVDFIIMGKRTCCLLYNREMKSIESMISLLLDTREGNDIDFVDDTGLSAFHVACCLKDSSVVHEYLQRNSDFHMQVHSDARFWPGWSPLHFAACFSPETFKLLLLKGADVNIKNTKGESALDMLMARYPPEVIHSILSAKDAFKNIVFIDKCTNLLDVIYLMNDCDKFNSFLQTLSNVNISIPADSPLWPGYTILHLAVSTNEKQNLGKFNYLKTALEKKLPLQYNCTEAEELSYWKRIVVCWAHRCSFTTKNADGLTPIHLALKLQKMNAFEKLMKCCKHDAVDPTGLSHLHIACAVGNESFVEEFLTVENVNSIVKINFKWLSNMLNSSIMLMQRIFDSSKLQPYAIHIRANSTPLHIAVIFENLNIIEYLLENGADVYARDSLGLTPIHLSMASSKNTQELAQLLLSKTPDIRESVTQHGLSHLHVAAFANDAEAVEKLIMQGADINRAFDIPERKFNDLPEYDLGEFSYLGNFAGQTPLHVAVNRDSSEAVRALIHNNADIHANTFNPSPVQCLKQNIHSKVVEHFISKFKRDGLEIGPIDFSNITALHFACARFDLKWTKKLLESGADVNAQIQYDEKNALAEWNGDTPLHSFIYEASIDTIRKPPGMDKLLKLLLKYGADMTIGGYQNETPLHSAYTSLYDLSGEFGDQQEDLKFLMAAGDLMLDYQKSHTINPADEYGFTHFHYACLRNKIEHVDKFLDNGVDVNLRTDCFWQNFSGFGPLHFACVNKAKDVVCLLIERGADVTAMDAQGNLPLHLAMRVGFVDEQIVDLMLKHGVDINAKNIFGTTPLECLINFKYFRHEQLTFLLYNGASMSVELCEEIIGLVMKNSALRERHMIIDEFFNICDVKSAIEKGFKAIHSAVSVSTDDDDDDDTLTVNDYLNVIIRLVKMGCDLDLQDAEGKTALHHAACNYNRQAVEALLNLGANLNVTDKNNESPFLKEIIQNANIDNLNEIRVVETLANHVWKMKLLDMHVNSYNKEAAETYTKYFQVNKAPRLSSEKELEIINSIKVNSLNLISAINKYFTLSSGDRKTVDNYFRCVNVTRRQFPQLSGLLRMKYSQIVVRKKLFDRAKNIFNQLCEIAMPQVCLNIILDYLKNYELINLIRTDGSSHIDFLL